MGPPMFPSPMKPMLAMMASLFIFAVAVAPGRFSCRARRGRAR